MQHLSGTVEYAYSLPSMQMKRGKLVITSRNLLAVLKLTIIRDRLKVTTILSMNLLRLAWAMPVWSNCMMLLQRVFTYLLLILMNWIQIVQHFVNHFVPNANVYFSMSEITIAKVNYLSFMLAFVLFIRIVSLNAHFTVWRNNSCVPEREVSS